MSSSSSTPKKPVVLIIRDGWGINPGGKAQAQANGDATLLASTPFHDKLYAQYPWSYISGSGEDVGLPAGQMGNSEVGHLNLGAGRIVYQDLTRINKAIREDTLRTMPALQEAFTKAKGKRLHLLGLVSDGGVHSHQDHLAALCALAQQAGCEEVLVHAITDGRDTAPKSGAGFLAKLEQDISSTGAKIATVIGPGHPLGAQQTRLGRHRLWQRRAAQ
jgi:2,3-bisphosphoglycerate-independent phosphoglycerate mutase